MPGARSQQLRQRVCSSHAPRRRAAAPMPACRRRLAASLQPAIVLTSDGAEDCLQQLATQVGARMPCRACTAHCSQTRTPAAPQIRRQLPCEAVVVTPAPGASRCPDELGFDAPLALTPQRHLQHTYCLAGASAADCVMCAADHKAGLLPAALGLAPILVLVGVHRGPALASGAAATLGSEQHGMGHWAVSNMGWH